MHRTEKYLMHCISQSCQPPAVEFKRRACTLNVYSVHIHTCEPTENLSAGLQQLISGHLNHQMQFSVPEGESCCFTNLSYLVWAIWPKDALGRVGLWMAQSLNRGVPKEVTAFQEQACRSQKEGSQPLKNAPLENPAFLLRGGEIFFPILENDAIRIILDALVDEVEDVGLWPTVQLSFDFLRVSVLCQLLPRFVNKEEEAVLFRVPHLKLLSTELTHILGGDIRSYEEGLSCAATVDFLECNSEVILQVERKMSGVK